MRTSHARRGGRAQCDGERCTARASQIPCRLLTLRFRLHLSKSAGFLAFFDASHSSGTEEQGTLREWNLGTRELLRQHIVLEATRLLHEAATSAVPGATPPEIRPTSSRPLARGSVSSSGSRLWDRAFTRCGWRRRRSKRPTRVRGGAGRGAAD